MRIVGGKYKGRTLLQFDGEDIRPTSDKVRESLFNIIQFKIYGKSFLDLFCGTGAMGIEALSRGAAEVVFNDYSKKSLSLLKKNLEKVKVEGGYSVINYDAVSFLNGNQKTFDFIYVDPPYKSDLGIKCLNAISNSLNVGGTVIFEDEKPFMDKIDGLKITDSRKYGRVHLTFFEKENSL